MTIKSYFSYDYQNVLGEVSYNYDLGMIQDRIEKLGRDVFYDMLSCGREPLHALCVLKVKFSC